MTRGDKGGEPGQWSARKAQMAVQAYKKRGGGYSERGAAKDETSLHEWTEADWGTRSGRQSGNSGERYLPKKVRMLLTEDEYARTTAKKRRDSGAKGEQFSDQPRDIREKLSRIKSDGPTKAMLDARAGELGIDGRSRMSKGELLKAIEKATNGEGRLRQSGRGAGSRLSDMSKAQLYERARNQGVEGRSKMSKDELVRALRV